MSGVRKNNATNGKSVDRALVSSTNFADFCRELSILYRIKLPEPSGPVTKGFLTGLLENPRDHPWGPLLRARHICRRTRLSIAGSLNSFCKTLPGSPPDLESYMTSMSSLAPACDPDYLNFCTESVRQMFPVGWDRGWRSAVLGTCASSSSCRSATRAQGGARRVMLRKRVEFLQTCMGIRRVPIPAFRRLAVAPCGGKNRIISVSPEESIQLLPLHRLMYGRLSKTTWLLRGEADPSSFFPDFAYREDEVFVSGDFKSATDNLPIDVSEAILHQVLRNCRFVPKSVQTEALRSLRCCFNDCSSGIECAPQRRGQLMGNYLSFPLLCIQNFLAFSFLVGKDTPVRINGDDIVFRAAPSVAKRWTEGIDHLGLSLSVGKTMICSRFFSLNSSYFDAKRETGVPILRASLLYRPIDDATSFAGRVSRVAVGWPKGVGSALKVALVKRFSSEIRGCQRSLSAMGLGLNRREIGASGFARWERFYRSMPNERAPPGLMEVRGGIPPSWRHVPCPLGGEDDPGFQRALVRWAWRFPLRVVRQRRYWQAVRLGTIAFTPEESSPRLVHLLSKVGLRGAGKRGVRGWVLMGRMPLTPRVQKKVWRKT
nr:MAG: putative RNA-dependent RNA polymerase [Magoulivirus sp.]